MFIANQRFFICSARWRGRAISRSPGEGRSGRGGPGVGRVRAGVEMDGNGSGKESARPSLEALAAAEVSVLTQDVLDAALDAARATGVLDLQQYAIADARLEELKPALLDLKDRLRVLILFYNEIAALPEWFGELHALQELHMGANPLEQVSAGALAGMRSLQHLDIGFGELLTSVPASLGSMEQLQVIMLGNCRLASVPDEIGKLQNLVELHLYGNHLKAVPAQLGDCASLRVLNLGRNQLTELPDSLGKLKNLEVLHLYENDLRKLPSSLSACTALRTVSIHNNTELEVLPHDVHRAGISALLEYYSRAKAVCSLRCRAPRRGVQLHRSASPPWTRPRGEPRLHMAVKWGSDCATSAFSKKNGHRLGCLQNACGMFGDTSPGAVGHTA
ncbi:Plant intracellular Ras-group-related LRR protein 4 [Porphyridium purpureum]|uniref:Plant intracellular Ras-group-related LRR protein 4 n=1 Tax=Porphyridium purpureum TaxID=35688 RepID=A0A5J4YL27_PORPP|nr:Plant intracellular Ras-group-related LRR protein 4 [Porphyridium purpureum]|eukprot:POR4400..scf210_14